MIIKRLQKEFGTLLVLSCCLVMIVVLVSVILVITVRVLHRANNNTGDTDSTYSPAREKVDTEAFSQHSVSVDTMLYSPDTQQPPHTDPGVYHLGLYNSSPPEMEFTDCRNSQIFGTVGRKIKPPTIATEESLAYQSNYF